MRSSLLQLLQTARCITGSTTTGVFRSLHCRTYSTECSKALLYRDFIQQSLYHPELGYFNKPQPPIRRLSQPINFNRILNQAEYNLVLSRIYKQLQVDWLTPVEVFAPWYGRAIAHYILEARKHTLHTANQPLAIIEIGGGTGTLAASILDHIAEKEPITYSAMSYSTIELSSTLAEQQRELVVQQRGHASAWRCIHGDAATTQAWADVAAAVPQAHRKQQQQPQQQHCFVLMMEVLDNLPHDRVVRQTADADWQQVAVTVQEHQQQHSTSSSSSGSSQRHLPHRQQQQYTEIQQPADDPLIQRCLQALYPQGMHANHGNNSSSSSKGRMISWFQGVLGLPDDEQNPLDLWLPTRCLQLLEVMHAMLPSHSLIAADFDALPDVRVPGKNAPLVSGRSADKVTIDYNSVLVPWGSADIFFPTNFDDLGKLYKAAAVAGLQLYRSEQQQQQQRMGMQADGRVVHCDHSSTADFMAAFAEARKTCLLSGYNPLVQDWPNTRVFLGHTNTQA